MMKFRRSYWVDIFFILPFLALFFGGVYKIIYGLTAFEFRQFDHVVLGCIMFVLGFLLLIYI